MCVRKSISMQHVGVYVYVHVQVYVYMYLCMQQYMYIYMPIRINIYAYMHAHIYIACIYICLQTYIYNLCTGILCRIQYHQIRSWSQDVQRIHLPHIPGQRGFASSGCLDRTCACLVGPGVQYEVDLATWTPNVYNYTTHWPRCAAIGKPHKAR